MTFEEKLRYLQENKEHYTVYIDFEYVEAIPNEKDSEFEVIEFDEQPRDLMFNFFKLFGLHTDTT